MCACGLLRQRNKSQHAVCHELLRIKSHHAQGSVSLLALPLRSWDFVVEAN